MKVPETELRLIDNLFEQGSFASVREAATVMDVSKAQVSRAANKLAAYGVVMPTATDGQLRLELNEGAPAVGVFRVFRQRHSSFPIERLSGRVLDVCWFLDEWRRTRTVADALGLSVRTVSPIINDLVRDAIVEKDGHEYRLARRYEELYDLAVSFAEAAWLAEVDGGGRDALLWTSPEEAVVVTEHPDSFSDTWVVSGAAAFEEFGVDLFLSEQTVLYAGHRNVSAERAVAHALLYNDNVRSVTHALLVVDSVEFDGDVFRAEAERVGVDADVVDAIVEYVQTGSLDDERLPSVEKMASLREQYGIDDVVVA